MPFYCSILAGFGPSDQFKWGWAKPTISSWPANGHSMFGNHRDISASRHCWGLLYWSNQFSVLRKAKVLPIRAVRVQAYHTKLSKCHIQAWLTLKRQKVVSSKTSLLNNPKSLSECISFEFKKNSSCIYLFGIWLFLGVLHWYIEECFIIFCFVICSVCLHVFWGGSKKVSIDTAGSVLSREKGPQASGAAGPDGKYRQRVNTKDTIAWAHPWK